MAEPKKEFLFSTRDIPALRFTFYGLKDATTEFKLFISPTGIKFGETFNGEHIMIAGSFKKENFEKYECAKTTVIFVNAKYMYDILSKGEARDLLTIWKYENEDTLFLQYQKFERDQGLVSQETLYECPLMLSDETGIWEADITSVDYIFAFATGVLIQTINGLANIEQEYQNSDQLKLKISVDEQGIEFFFRGNYCVDKATVRFKAITSENPNPIEEKKPVPSNSQTITNVTEADKLDKEATLARHRNPISNVYLLRHVKKIMNCLNVNKGYVKMYFKQSRPLIFESEAGTLGVIRICLIHDSEEENEDGEGEEVVEEEGLQMDVDSD